jgi:hypothetical protein
MGYPKQLKISLALCLIPPSLDRCWRGHKSNQIRYRILT